MEQFNAVFEYFPAHRIGVCETHHQAVLQPEIRTHLNSRHKELTPRTRSNVVLATAAYQQWAATEDEVVYPSAASEPIPHLPVFNDGLACVLCGYIRRTKQGIQAHCREMHGWENSGKRGRTYKGCQLEAQIAWRNGVWCQKFQSARRLGRLFEVSQPSHSRAPVEDSDMQEAVQVSLSQATERFDAAEQKKQAKIQADQDRFQYSAWLNGAGWAKHLKGLDRQWVSTLTRKPARGERGLDQVCWAVEMVIWKAQQASRPDVVGMNAMNYINRREVGNNTNEKPFNARQTGKTMVKYSGWWLEMIRYIWRSHGLLEVQYKEGQADVEGRRPPYRLTVRQEVLLQKMQAIVGQDQEDDWFDELDSSDSDNDLDPSRDAKVQEFVLAFMLALLDHVLADDEHASALISAMSVLGIDADCGWMSALIYTPRQAAVVNVSRMLVLYRSTQLRKDSIRVREKGWGCKDAQDMASSHYHFVKEMANRFMTLTSYGGEPTPIDAIQRLKAYGMKIRYTTNAEGVADWVDNTLLYGNIQFSMPQLRSMVHGMMASTRHQLRKELMLLQVDEEGAIMAQTTALPAIHWDRMVDNPAERRTGWSFMEDARNRAAIDAEDPPMWLGRRVGEEKQLRDAFIDATAT